MYMRQLDGLRCIAVALVIAGHWHVIDGKFGALGVRIFFVLSGFLVTSILLRGGSLKSFYARRALRIFPAFYLVVLVAFVAGQSNIRENWLSTVTYTGNFASAFLGGGMGFGHFWSLYIEEQFYMVWPFVIFFMPRKYLLYTIALVMAGSALYRSMAFIFTEDIFISMFLPMSCMDTLGAGALLAHCKREGIRIPLLWLGPIAMAAELFVPGLHEGAGYALYDLAAAWFGAWLVSGASQGFGGIAGVFLSNPVAVYLGRISYGLYLIHLPVLVMYSGRSLYGIPVAVALSVLMFHLWETPWNNLKRFFPYERQPDAPLEHIVMERHSGERFGHDGDSRAAHDARDRLAQAYTRDETLSDEKSEEISRSVG